MSSQRFKVLASVFVVLWTGFYSQAILVHDEVKLSIASRESSAPDDENQSAVANDDFDDASDDFVPLHGTVNWSSPLVSMARSLGDDTIICAPRLSSCATLKSRHILLRL
jgi:hypothetical protein